MDERCSNVSFVHKKDERPSVFRDMGEIFTSRNTKKYPGLRSRSDWDGAKPKISGIPGKIAFSRCRQKKMEPIIIAVLHQAVRSLFLDSGNSGNSGNPNRANQLSRKESGDVLMPKNLKISGFPGNSAFPGRQKKNLEKERKSCRQLSYPVATWAFLLQTTSHQTINEHSCWLKQEFSASCG